jgi:peroxiredoxin
MYVKRRFDMRLPQTLKFSSDHVVLLALLALSLGFNLKQAAMLRGRPPSAATVKGYEKGDTLPTLTVTDAAGKESILAFSDDRPTVLYVFRPSCPWCRRNSLAVASLRAAIGERYGFVGLSLDGSGLKEFATGTSMNFPAYVLKGAATRRFVSVPETFVVGRGGVVLEKWSGAYGAETATAVQTYFGASLPKLIAEPGV